MAELAVDVARFADHGSNPPVLANSGKYYSKNVSGTIHWFYESDAGVVYQLTPVTPASGSVSYTALNNGLTIGTQNVLGTSASTSLPLFGTANNTFTLASNTTYQFRLFIQIPFPALPGVYNARLGFEDYAFGEAPTTGAVYTISYSVFGYGFQIGGGTTAGVEYGLYTVQTPSDLFTSTNPQRETYDVEGIIVVSTGGTFCPTLYWTAGVASAPPIPPDTYCELIPLGSNTFTQQGGWV